jgi:Flp pilus assembly protein TadB
VFYLDSGIFLKNSLLQIFGKEKIKNFEEKLESNGSKTKEFSQLAEKSALEGIILVISAPLILTLFLGQQFVGEKIGFVFLFCGIIFFLPLLAKYFFHEAIFEMHKRKKEEMLADMLLEASVFCDENSFFRTMKLIAEQDYGLLSKEFKKVVTEMDNGMSVSEALSRMKNRNKSRAITRVIDLLEQGYKSGAQMSGLFKETAEDILETQSIIKERQASMLVTKYTLLLSSGLIVPAILGLMIGLVGGMGFGGMSGLGLGMNVEQREGIFGAASFGALIYVIEFAGLSAFFLAIQEGNKKQSIPYATVLVPIAFVIFTTAKAF